MLYNVRFIEEKDGTTTIEAIQGSTWVISLQLTNADGSPKNLVGCSVKGQMRKTYDAAMAYTFLATITNPQEGQIVVRMEASETAKIPCGPDKESSLSQYVYDIELTDEEGNVKKILRGRLKVIPEVTKI